MDEKVNDWVKISEYALETAQVMLRTEKYLYVGFMCHQAIERVLKGYYLLAINTTPPRTGNLRLLAQESGLHSRFSEEQISFLLVLETLSEEIRHPEFKDEISGLIDRKRSKEMISSARELHAWIRDTIEIKANSS
ncbi:MAG: HEPN domain-containing [Geobacteraceae bacterium]|nr:MAG: HEPN domain-containing [Geobacteraceae bacterium]